MNYPKQKGIISNTQTPPKSHPKILSKLNLRVKPEVKIYQPEITQVKNTKSMSPKPKSPEKIVVSKPKSPEKKIVSPKNKSPERSLILNNSVSFPTTKSSSPKNRLVSPPVKKNSPQKLIKLNRYVKVVSPKSISSSESLNISLVKNKSQPNFYFSKAFVNFVNNYSEIDQSRHKLFIGGFKTKEVQLYNNIMNTINEFIYDPNMEQHYNLYKKYLSNPPILAKIKRNSNKTVIQKFNKHIDELLNLVLKYRILLNEKNQTEQQYLDLFYNTYGAGIIISQKEKKDMDTAEKALENFEKTYEENISKKIEMYFLDIIEVYDSNEE